MAARSIADYYFAIRNLLPASRIAFAYGSAAYQQQGKALVRPTVMFPMNIPQICES